jgi:hypothetical protein
MYLLLVTGMPLDWVWRAALGIGAVPGLLTVYGRLRVSSSAASSVKPSTPRHQVARALLCLAHHAYADGRKQPLFENQTVKRICQ